MRGRRNVDIAKLEGNHAVSVGLPCGRGLRDEGSFSAQPFETERELLHLFYSSLS
jgi:hypothetical protein